VEVIENAPQKALMKKGTSEKTQKTRLTAEANAEVTEVNEHLTNNRS
jgi:hypothetical protein